MKIQWTTTASVILGSGDTSVVFDPFFPLPLKDKGTYLKESIAEIYRQADAVFLTHGHFDHALFVPLLYKDTEVPVYATRTPADSLIKRGMDPDQVRMISPGDRIGCGPFEITVYQGRHCVFDAGIVLGTVFSRKTIRNLTRMMKLIKLNRKFKENGETVYYDIRCEGKRIGILGSMNYSENETYPDGADILVLPFQGRSDIDTYALGIVGRFRPKSVFLDHFDDSFPPMSSGVYTGTFEDILKKKNIEILKPESGREYII